MKVKRLIELLSNCPQDLDVAMYYDGAPRLMVDSAFLDKISVWKDDDQQWLNVVVLCEKDDAYNYYGPWLFDDSRPDNEESEGAE